VEDYDAITFDDEKIGHVVGRQGSYLVVEHGSIFKHRRPVPVPFATVDDDARVVRLTVSKEILEAAPEVKDGRLDEHAAAVYYGLIYEAAPAGDEAQSADRERAERELEREAESRSHLGRGQGSEDRPLPSPGVTGGDRYRDRDTD
jgi:hypothetical protein